MYLRNLFELETLHGNVTFYNPSVSTTVALPCHVTLTVCHLTVALSCHVTLTMCHMTVALIVLSCDTNNGCSHRER